MKLIRLFTVIIVVSMIGYCLEGVLPGSLKLIWPLGEAQISVRSTAPTITELQQLSHLCSHWVHMTDILVGDGEGFQGSWIVKGDALLAVDLARGAVVHSDIAARSALIRLPQPCVLSARVDHAKTRKWNIKRNTWVQWIFGHPDRLADEAMRAAQTAIDEAARKPANIAEARKRVELLLKDYFASMGWKARIQWER